MAAVVAILTEVIRWRHFTKRADGCDSSYPDKSFDDVTSPNVQMAAIAAILTEVIRWRHFTYPAAVSRLRRKLSWRSSFVGLPCFPRQMLRLEFHDCFLPHPLHPYHLAAYRREILTASFTYTANQTGICQSKSVSGKKGNSEWCSNRSCFVRR